MPSPSDRVRQRPHKAKEWLALLSVCVRLLVLLLGLWLALSRISDSA